MHLGAEASRRAACPCICGPDTGVRVVFVEKLGDCETVPDDRVTGAIVDLQRRHGRRRVIVFEKLLVPGHVQGHDLVIELDAKSLEQQPTAQRPAGISLVPKYKVIAHCMTRYRNRKASS
jgi:hypothetical protein